MSGRPYRLPSLILGALALGAAAFLRIAAAQEPPGGGEVHLDDQLNKRLPKKLERKVLKAVRQGEPETVEALLAGRPMEDRIYVARAFARAGIDCSETTRRDERIEQAVMTYRQVLGLTSAAGWLRGDRRRLLAAEWHVEAADLILRYWIARDLDRMEITSRLDFNRDRLKTRLREALDDYQAAGRLLDDLMADLRIEEERFLLLGIADDIARLHEQHLLGSAWAAVHYAVAAGPKDPQSANLSSSALTNFDAISRTTSDETRKYNALIGAGVTLCNKGRLTEADMAFDRVLESASPAALIARARFEKARGLLQARQYERARRELQILAASEMKQSVDADAGIRFYVELAPLIHAHAFLLESDDVTSSQSGRKEALRKKGFDELDKIAARGAPWPEIVDLYLRRCGGDDRPLVKLSNAELSGRAANLMTAQDYTAAAQVLEAVLRRPSMASQHAEAEFNLGVCRFQVGDSRAAAQAFASVAFGTGKPELRTRAAEHAFRCRRQVASESRGAADYLALAESGRRLVEAFPESDLAGEAAWISAVAAREAGDVPGSLQALRLVPTDSPNYWPARRSEAACMQRLYDGLDASASARQRTTAALDAAETWERLAEDLEERAAVRILSTTSRAAAPAQTSEDLATTRDLVATSQTAEPERAQEELAASRRSNATDSRPADRRAATQPAVPDDTAKQIAEARLAAATLWAGDDVRSFKKALNVVAGLPATPQALALRVRCLRGLGDLDAARNVLADFLQQATSEEAGSLLIGLAAEMDAEVQRLSREGWSRDAQRVAADSAETIQTLLGWIERHAEYAQHAPVVRFSLAKAMAMAGQPQEAMKQMDKLMAEFPDDGEYAYTAAGIQDKLARSAETTQKAEAAAKAERLWARLLADGSLRARRPAVYWEARHRWLEIQLDRGRAADVLRGIQTEKALYPDLGGPPWHDALLGLADRARAAVSAGAGATSRREAEPAIAP